MKKRIERIFLGRYNLTENLTGPEKVAKRIFDKYTQSNNSVFIEYFFDGSKFNYFKKLLGKEFLINKASSKIIRFGILRLFFYFLKERPSQIHIVTYERFALVSFLYKLFFKTIIIYNLHGNIYHENINYKKVKKSYILKDKICEKIFLKHSDKLLFLSESSVNLASKYYKFDKTKIEIIPNGIDKVFYLSEQKKIFEHQEKLKIVFVGDVKRIEKGFEFISECLQNVSFKYDFYIIGNYTKEDMMKYANENYHFLENVDTDRFASFLKDKEIYLSGSIYEPFSIAAVECMASGLVPIVTRETGMSKYITHLSNGFVFDFNDKQGFIYALETLSSNKELLYEMSERAKLIYNDLSWDKVFKKYEIIYGSFK